VGGVEKKALKRGKKGGNLLLTFRGVYHYLKGSGKLEHMKILIEGTQKGR